MKTINHNKNTKRRHENTRQTLFDIRTTHFWWSICQKAVCYNSILLLHDKKTKKCNHDTAKYKSIAQFEFVRTYVVNVLLIKLPYIFSMRHIVREVQNHKNTTTLRNPCCSTSVAASSIPRDGLHPTGYSPLTSWIREIWPQMMSIWPSALLCLKTFILSLVNWDIYLFLG